jgi:transposase
MATIKTRHPIANSSRKPARKPTVVGLPVLDPHTAGIDIGATALTAAVPPDRDAQPVRTFGTFTGDLETLAQWLLACGVQRVAMEATGVYWIPVWQLLAAAGLQCCLVNPRHVKNVRGRKSDVSDAQWLQHLHAVGLLQPSFRPEDHICALRTLYRQREHLVEQAAQQIQLMQKSLDQMNLHLHHVLSDLAGVSGQRILQAILAGERDPQVLAGLRDRRVRADGATVVAALTGDWRPEHLFTLRQAHATFTHFAAQVQACDAELEAWLRQHPVAPEAQQPPTPPAPPKQNDHRNAVRLPELNLQQELHQRFGVDLVAVPSLGVTTVCALYTELGADLSAFESSARFCSWLDLCPNPQKSNQRVLRSGTRRIRHRVAGLFRQAAESMARSDCHLGSFYRQMRAKLGPPQAVTATAHKIARIFFHMVTTKEAYDATIYERKDEQAKQRRLARLKREAKALGFALQPT